MEMERKIRKSEWVLLGLTAAFLCVLAALWYQDRQAAEEPVRVRTEVEAAREDLAPAFTPVDLNTATEEELDSLPGIGPALARRIVAYRAEHGPFGAVEELLNVSGIGPETLAELADWAAVGGGTAPAETEEGEGT